MIFGFEALKFSHINAKHKMEKPFMPLWGCEIINVHKILWLNFSI